MNLPEPAQKTTMAESKQSRPEQHLAPHSEAALSRMATETLRRGREYAQALLVLDPRLAHHNPEDEAVALDVGPGTDAIAFKELGFSKALITNSSSAVFDLFLEHSADEEASTRAVLTPYYPADTQVYDHLAVSDILRLEGFSPRLTTMLVMAPGYFGENEAEAVSFFEFFIAHLTLTKPDQTIVLSAENDHPLSMVAFKKASELLTSQGVRHQLWLDDQVPPGLRTLGSRILVIKT